MKRIRNIVGTICVFPLKVVVVVLALPFFFVMEVKAAIALLILRRREAGHVFLICTSRRDWHDFLKNNVIPVLPDNLRVVWVKSVRESDYPNLIDYLVRSHIFGVSKPYLVAVTPKAFFHRSLNITFQELKSQPKRSADVQRSCLEVINQNLKELRATAPLTRAG